MIYTNHREIIRKKINRQKSIKELEYHAHGDCVHIGEISPGCRECFSNESHIGFQIGFECQFKCSMCYYDRDKNDVRDKKIEKTAEMLTDHFHHSLFKNDLMGVSFQSSGETLLYLDDIYNFAVINKKIERDNNIKIYQFLYTNGILATRDVLKKLKDMNIHELRFHVSASNFSKKVVDNMYEAAKMGFTVSVEEPSWPIHKEKLFDFLPVMEDIGVRHFNLIEIEVTKWNKDVINKLCPTGKLYKDALYHLYDEGLVYDIIEEVIKKKYSFSVLDCNSWVEHYRHVKDDFGKDLFDLNSVRGMCASFDYGNRGENFIQ